MAIYKISLSADRDLINIYIRGHQIWGEKQADNYRDKLISIFNLLAENVDIGHSVAIRPELLRYDINPYVIFYRKFSYGIRIARVLYKNRKMEKYL